MEPLSKAYDPQGIESKWYATWKENGYFKPSGKGEPFTIVIPPPNITGKLHMGHGLNMTLQDIAIRFNRMLGKNTLWLPGEDHAGIATQGVIEKNLREKGTSRDAVGREEFLRRRLLAYNKRNLAYILLVAGEHQAGLRHLVEAVRLHPQGRSLWAYLAGALLAPRLVRRRWASRVNLAPPQPSWQQAIPAVPDAGVQGEAADRASARVRSPSV